MKRYLVWTMLLFISIGFIILRQQAVEQVSLPLTDGSGLVAHVSRIISAIPFIGHAWEQLGTENQIMVVHIIIGIIGSAGIMVGAQYYLKYKHGQFKHIHERIRTQMQNIIRKGKDNKWTVWESGGQWEVKATVYKQNFSDKAKIAENMLFNTSIPKNFSVKDLTDNIVGKILYMVHIQKIINNNTKEEKIIIGILNNENILKEYFYDLPILAEGVASSLQNLYTGTFFNEGDIKKVLDVPKKGKGGADLSEKENLDKKPYREKKIKNKGDKDEHSVKNVAVDNLSQPQKKNLIEGILNYLNPFDERMEQLSGVYRFYMEPNKLLKNNNFETLLTLKNKESVENFLNSLSDSDLIQIKKDFKHATYLSFAMKKEILRD